MLVPCPRPSRMPSPRPPARQGRVGPDAIGAASPFRRCPAAVGPSTPDPGDPVGRRAGPPPRTGLDDVVAGEAEYVANQLEVQRIVLDDQDAARRHRAPTCF